MPVNDDSPVFRRAVHDDVDGILNLLSQPAAKGLILPRTRREISAVVKQFIVAEVEGYIIGCVTLKNYGQKLFEVRSLAVAPEARGRGTGTQLIREAVRSAEKKSASRIFALTYRPNLFEQLQFQRVPKDLFPQKVWDDCSQCPKRDRCDETAVLLKC